MSPFSVRDTIASAFAIVARTWGRLLGLAFVQAVLTWAMTTLVHHVAAPVSPVLAYLLNLVVEQAGIAIGTGAIVEVSFAAAEERYCGFGEALRASLGNFGPMVVVCVLESVVVGLGLLLLIVPGFIAMVVLAAAVPACMIEEIGPFAAFSRSAVLTRGHRWALFGLITLAALVGLVAVAATLLPFYRSNVLTIAVAILGALAILALVLVSLALSSAIYVALRRAEPSPATTGALGPEPRAAL